MMSVFFYSLRLGFVIPIAAYFFASIALFIVLSTLKTKNLESGRMSLLVQIILLFVFLFVIVLLCFIPVYYSAESIAQKVIAVVWMTGNAVTSAFIIYKLYYMSIFIKRKMDTQNIECSEQSENKVFDNNDSEVIAAPKNDSMMAFSDLATMSSGTFEKEHLELLQKFEKYMQSEKPFLTKDICINEVAVRLFTNKTYLSKVINLGMKRNFRELINYYRIAEAMKLLSDQPDMCLKDLCQLSGFKTLTTFTSAFKAYVGDTPGRYCRMIRTQQKEQEWRMRNADIEI